jgi:signal transduction histidine kinase
VSAPTSEPTSREGELAAQLAELHTQDVERRSRNSRLTLHREGQVLAACHLLQEDMGQALLAARAQLHTLSRKLGSSEDGASVTKVAEALDRAASRLSSLLTDLYPAALERQGLGAALQALLEQLRTLTRAEVVLEDNFTTQPGPETRALLYRIAQEAVENIRLHARATKVTIALASYGGGFLVRIVDDGKGFDAANAGQTAPGLGTMREMADIFDGWCQLSSTPGGGCTVEAWMPPVDTAGSHPPTGSFGKLLR